MRSNEFITEEEHFPSVNTLTVAEIVKKHDVSTEQIEQQLAKGTKVELEHTTNRSAAREIALDHLAEYPDYYDRLEMVEK